MRNHTPGPWSVWTSCSFRRIGNDAASRAVCEPVVQSDGHPDLYFRNGGADGPDARLITAAPDLLDLAEAFREVCARVIEQYGAVHHGIDYTALAGRVNQVLAAVEGDSDVQDPSTGSKT